MTPLDKVKLELRRFFIRQFDGSLINILGIIEKSGQIILFYTNKNAGKVVNSAISDDGFSFVDSPKKHSLPPSFPQYPKACYVSDFFYDGKELMYFGERSINIAYKINDIWKKKTKPIITTSYPLEACAVFKRKQGLLLLYYQKIIEKGITYYSAYMSLFDKNNPEKTVWRTEHPLWKHKDIKKKKKARPLGAVMHKEKIIAYWLVEEKIVFGIILSGFKYDPDSIHQKGKITLKKYVDNPIIAPKPENDWEAFNTLNPAALYVDNKVHILYRAQGFDYISTVGYAVSKDGVNINMRLNQPIYRPTMDFENNYTGKVNLDLMSAGGYGGCEDPRVTLLEKKIYMIYVAFNGWYSVRLALTSILLNDFLNQRWNWTKPILISCPGVIDKSGCLLPEKINGKYVFFHRIFPNILVDYVDDLSFKGKNNYLKNQYQIKIRKNRWDSRKIGVGAPPLKTKDGWLLIYYGVNDTDTNKYHIGAMLLDLQDPRKVLNRCNEPILEPTENYENIGFKPGIAYPCGAVIIKNKLLVYYGGADTVVCVAEADLDTFLQELKSKKTIHLHSIKIKEVQYQL